MLELWTHGVCQVTALDIDGQPIQPGDLIRHRAKHQAALRRKRMAPHWHVKRFEGPYPRCVNMTTGRHSTIKRTYEFEIVPEGKDQ